MLLMLTSAAREAYSPTSLEAPSALDAATTGATSVASTTGPAKNTYHSMESAQWLCRVFYEHCTACTCRQDLTCECARHDARKAVMIVGRHIRAQVQQVVRGLDIEALLYFRVGTHEEMEEGHGEHKGITQKRGGGQHGGSIDGGCRKTAA